MPKRKKPAPPPNPAARALREGQFQAKVVRNPKAYTRKVKHKQGSTQHGAPLFVAPPSRDANLEEDEN